MEQKSSIEIRRLEMGEEEGNFIAVSFLGRARLAFTP